MKPITINDIADAAMRQHQDDLDNVYACLGGDAAVKGAVVDYCTLHPEVPKAIAAGDIAGSREGMDKTISTLIQRGVLKPLPPGWSPEAIDELNALQARVTPIPAYDEDEVEEPEIPTSVVNGADLDLVYQNLIDQYRSLTPASFQRLLNSSIPGSKLTHRDVWNLHQSGKPLPSGSASSPQGDPLSDESIINLWKTNNVEFRRLHRSDAKFKAKADRLFEKGII